MKNNESESSSYSNQRLKPKKIVSKKQINKKTIDNNDNSGKREYDTNVIFSRTIKPSNFYKYRKMSSKIYSQTNSKINTTIKKSKFDDFNNNSNSKKTKLINSKPNEKNNLFLPTENNTNLKADISAYLLNSKNNKGIGTKLDISKSEIQYPLNYSKNEINNKNNIINSSQESKNKEINLRISLKIGNKNNKEKERKYNISSPLNKANHSFNKKLRKSMKNLEYINKRKNHETYSPDLIKFTNNFREMKSFNNNNFYTKRDNVRINTFNSCYNFYQKDDFNSRRKKEERNFNDSSFNNTMNHNDFHNYRINNEDENSYQLDYENMNRNNKYFFYHDDIKYINANPTDRYKNENSNEEIQIQKNIKENEYLSYQNEIIEEFCNSVEEFMFWRVKNNFDTFISNLKDCSRTKYFNSLLLKRIQNQSIKKKFSNDQCLSSTINANNKINTYKKLVNPSNILSKDCFKRKTMTNFNKNNLDLSNKIDKNKENTYYRKSQEKYNLKNPESYYKKRNAYDINNEKFEKERRISNEKYDTNLYIPKKYRHLDNAHVNQTHIKKNVSYNYSKINPYFTSINNKDDISQNLSQENDNTNISADIDEEMIKSKLERSANKKNKKNKNHNISCDNKYNTNFYLEKGILSKIKSNISNNSSMTMNIGHIKDNINNLPIYNKKKIRISQPKSKIFINKQLHGNIIEKNTNKIKGEPMFNIAHNKIINNKNKNNNEHYGIMTLSSNVSDNSEDKEQNKNNDLNDYKMISPKNNNYSSNPNNNMKNIDTKENNIKYQENIIINQKQLNSEKINEQNGNGYKIGTNKSKNNIKQRESNIQLCENNKDIRNSNDSYKKMNNGKNSITDEDSNNKINYYLPREIIVKDVSTRDRRINVFIKYIEYFNYKFINRKTQKNLLILFQSDSIYIPSAYPQKNNLYQNNSKFYKNMNDKNNHNKMNKILSSIIEEEERSKAAGSMNNSINSEDENLKNGNYTYFFIQSIKYFIGFLQSIFNDKKKTYCFQFFKHLKKIKNDSYLKGLISQKKIQILNKIKEDKDNSDNKNNTSGDILLYNINDNFDFDINSFNEVKNQNQNPKNKFKKTNNTSEGKYSFDNNKFCLFINEQTYKLSYSNKKAKINLSMDNFYLDKKEENKKYDKNIFKKILNNIEINNQIQNDEIFSNGQNEIKTNINKDDNKNISLNDMNIKFSDLINQFRVYLMKYGIKK